MKLKAKISRLVGGLKRGLTEFGPGEKYSRQTEAPPVFIVGCGHSGTSILLRILGVHSRIHAVAAETSVGFASQPALIMRGLDRETAAAGKARWIEKTPSHIRCIERLLSLCPDAKILLMMRDGRDVAFSLQKRGGTLEEGIRRWMDDNRAGELFWKDPRVKIVKYEDLISDPEGTLARVLDFLEEQMEPDMLLYHQKPRSFYSSSFEKPAGTTTEFHGQYRNWQINQPLFDGRGRWRDAERKDLLMIEDLAGGMLREYGYGPEADS